MTEGMYGDRAALYDRIYHWKDYVAEARLLVERLAAMGVGDGARVLEVACGTGSFLAELADRYDVAGLDREAAMLVEARAKLPDVELIRADMTEFSVERPFDALLCLFSSIGYLPDEAALARALGRFHAALRPGGVLIVEPWLAPDVYRDGISSLQTYEDDDLKLARMSHSGRRNDVSVIDFEWLVGRTGRPVERFRERHELWLCPRETMREAMVDAGFDTAFQAEGLGGPVPRGIFVGRR